ncbi:MAG: FAD-binding oxidoreductase [Hyphomicrobiales bacterium]|nr:FAD-binding oxidoreductase [Hyphomicrobiales bacterium]MBV9426354.1 FAD-binding oxidoreductase [Bradyrhizobiaceae bacterium]
MAKRTLVTRRHAVGTSTAALLAATGLPWREAKAQLVGAAGGTPGSDLLVLVPDNSQFLDLTQGFNRRWTAPNCGTIFLPLTEAGAEEALTRAVSFGPGRFRVRSGGHCYEDFVFNDETRAVIDVSLLNEVGFDAQNGVYYAQSGGTNWDLYRHLYWRYGLTLPAGSCYSVGLGGHICGGGYGLLSRQFGLTVDWLTGVRVVTVDENHKAAFNRATKQDGLPLQDLYWAHTGGGGGNFGLVTRYEFARLPAAPRRAELIITAWSWSDIKNDADLGVIIEAFEHLVSAMPPTAFAILKLSHQAAKQITLIVQSAYDGASGSSNFAAQVADWLGERCTSQTVPAKGTIGGHPVYLPCPLPYQDLLWFEAVQTLNGSGPNQKGKYKSAYMRKGFPPEQIKTIYNYLTKEMRPQVDMSQSLLQVDSYGEQINTVDPRATAVWQRSSILKLQYQTYWQEPQSGPDADDPHIVWIREFYREMYKDYGHVPDPARDATDNVDGCYINYPDVDLNDYGGRMKALTLYYGDNLARLRRAKRAWDPHDYFRNAQSIPPAENGSRP